MSNLWTNISGIKWIVYQPKIFGIWSLFVLFRLVWHRIVGTKMNTAITYSEILDLAVNVCLQKHLPLNLTFWGRAEWRGWTLPGRLLSASQTLNSGIESDRHFHRNLIFIYKTKQFTLGSYYIGWAPTLLLKTRLGWKRFSGTSLL